MWREGFSRADDAYKIIRHAYQGPVCFVDVCLGAAGQKPQTPGVINPSERDTKTA